MPLRSTTYQGLGRELKGTLDMSKHTSATPDYSTRLQPKPRIATEPQSVPGCRWVALTQAKFALVDEEDFQLVSKYNWSFDRYATRGAMVDGKHRLILMHRQLMGLGYDDPREVDHKDLNKLNNTRDNLRICTRAQNQMNTPLPKANTSGYRGVTFDKSRRLWMSRIKMNRKHIHIGRYHVAEDAARAYDAKARELFGEFARLNFP